jgi:hypothetical protein
MQRVYGFFGFAFSVQALQCMVRVCAMTVCPCFVCLYSSFLLVRTVSPSVHVLLVYAVVSRPQHYLLGVA